MPDNLLFYLIGPVLLLVGPVLKGEVWVFLALFAGAMPLALGGPWSARVSGAVALTLALAWSAGFLIHSLAATGFGAWWVFYFYTTQYGTFALILAGGWWWWRAARADAARTWGTWRPRLAARLDRLAAAIAAFRGAGAVMVEQARREAQASVAEERALQMAFTGAGLRPWTVPAAPSMPAVAAPAALAAAVSPATEHEAPEAAPAPGLVRKVRTRKARLGTDEAGNVLLRYTGWDARLRSMYWGLKIIAFLVVLTYHQSIIRYVGYVMGNNSVDLFTGAASGIGDRLLRAFGW